MPRTNNDQKHLRQLRDTYAQLGCVPSYSEIAKALGFKAKNAAYKLTQRLIASGHLTKSVGGRLVPGPAFFTYELGQTEARSRSDETDTVAGMMHSQALTQLLMVKPSRTMLVELRGGSMRDAGILSGDIAVVETNCEALIGDIVVAEIDGEPTIKALKNERGSTRLLSQSVVKSAAPVKRPNILGVVRGIVRSYRPPVGDGAKIKRKGVFR